MFSGRQAKRMIYGFSLLSGLALLICAPVSVTAQDRGHATLTGEKAVAALKQEGVYDTLNAAVGAARYQVTPVDSGAKAAYQAYNPANELRTDFTREEIRMAPRSSGSEGAGMGLRRAAARGHDLVEARRVAGGNLHVRDVSSKRESAPRRRIV